MTLPKQVEQQLKELEVLEKQLQAPVEPEETAASEEPAEPQVPQAAEVVPTEPVAQDVDWEQRYRTLAGKYDAEVPRLHTQVKELAAQLQALQQTRPEPPQDTPPERFVTDEDVEAFGSDMIEVTRKVAKEVAAQYDKKLSAYESKIAALEQRLMQTGSQVGEMTFEQRLLRAVPDFDLVNADERWISWLNEVDPVIRGPRRVMAEQVYNAGDVEGVAHYVNLFKQTLAPVQPDTRQAELERQVAPSRATGTAQVTPQARQYTAAQVELLFAKVRDLNIKGKYDEAAKLEAELTSAYAEGRVTR
jgi:hypothetical protein